MQISVIYEDESVLVINKPSGILVHPDGISKEKTIVDWAIENYPTIKDVGEEQTLSNGKKIKRPGIVHRLDKETSGALMICKTQEAFEYLKKQFQASSMGLQPREKNIKKEYHALVYGTIIYDNKIIDKPIGRHPTDFRRRLAEDGARGEIREAITKFEVIERTKEATFIHAFPLTGRTHQIRVHMKAINHPIVCDSLYAPKQKCLFGMERLALHAYQITWIDMGGVKKVCTAPYPADFENALREFHSRVKVPL